MTCCTPMPEKTLSPLGERIKQLQGKLTNVDLANAVDLSRNQLYLLTIGESGTTQETMKRFVQVFGLTKRKEIEDFFGLAGFVAPPELLPPIKDTSELTYEREPDADRPDIMAFYDNLPPDDQDELLQIAKMKAEKHKLRTLGKRAE